MASKFDHMAYPSRPVANLIDRMAALEQHAEARKRNGDAVPDLGDIIKHTRDRGAIFRAQRIETIFTTELGHVTVGWLEQHGIKRVADLVQKSAHELSKLQGIGPKSVEVIKSKLADLGGLHLRRAPSYP